MPEFKFLDIATADMAFEAYGRTLDELFDNAGKALFRIMFEKLGEREIAKEIVLEAESIEELLYDWLEELLFIFDTEGLVYGGSQIKIEKNRLRGKTWWEPMKDKHGFIVDVKAITWHMFKLEKEGDIWKARVIVDV